MRRRIFKVHFDVEPVLARLVATTPALLHIGWSSLALRSAGKPVPTFMAASLALRKMIVSLRWSDKGNQDSVQIHRLHSTTGVSSRLVETGLNSVTKPSCVFRANLFKLDARLSSSDVAQ